MQPLSLPLRQDVPAFSYTVDLDGKAYQLSFMWNGRESLWHLGIATAAGAVVLLGLPLAVDFPLLFSMRSNKALPPGEFIVVDLEGSGGSPGRDNLGTRFEVLYYTAADMAELLSGTGG